MRNIIRGAFYRAVIRNGRRPPKRAPNSRMCTSPPTTATPDRAGKVNDSGLARRSERWATRRSRWFPRLPRWAHRPPARLQVERAREPLRLCLLRRARPHPPYVSTVNWMLRVPELLFDPGDRRAALERDSGERSGGSYWKLAGTATLANPRNPRTLEGRGRAPGARQSAESMLRPPSSRRNT